MEYEPLDMNLFTKKPERAVEKFLKEHGMLENKNKWDRQRLIEFGIMSLVPCLHISDYLRSASTESRKASTAGSVGAFPPRNGAAREPQSSDGKA